jgi:ABC-type bacteriocin/lantibiotic exporter with double-glycine peptidase domain
LNLEIKNGDRIAFTGKSGSGKSTFADILLGLLKPSAGTITLNSQTPAAWIREHPEAVAYIPQESSVFTGTIEENICLSNLSIDKDRLFSAIKIAKLGTFVDSLPSKEMTIVGPGATELSGGEKQRLGIARALYQNPRILVMDESTSSLDSTTEQAIMDEILRIENIQVIIAIAHRLSSIKKFNRVIFMENGKIVGDGNMESLRANVPNFAALFRDSRIAEL